MVAVVRELPGMLFGRWLKIEKFFRITAAVC